MLRNHSFIYNYPVFHHVFIYESINNLLQRLKELAVSEVQRFRLR
jgi:hypothetical protein